MRVPNNLPHSQRFLRHLFTDKRVLVFALLASFLLGLVALSGINQVTGAHTTSAFTPGNLVIYRVGTGTGSLSSAATAVFLDEYTTAGAFVQAIPLPTAVNGSNKRLTAAGTSSSEGLLTRSVDASYLTLTGYDADVGTLAIAGTSSSTVNRVVGRVDSSGAINTTTALSDAATGSNPRSAVSTNGTDLWMDGGAGGIRYTTLGSITSTQLSSTVTNLRQTNIFAGQLYVSDSSGTAVRLGTVGSGTPTTSGQTITNLPGFAVTGSPYAFFFADLDAGVSGVDTLYVADDTNGAGGGITKYSLVSGSWTSNGTVGTAADSYRGLTGTVSGSTVTLYIVRKGGTGAAGGGELATLVDASGYNAAFSGTPTLLATAAANTAFRGVAFAPAPTSTNPSGVGAANPNSVAPGGSTLLTVTVTPGTTPPSTGLAVSANLSMIGLSVSQMFFDDGSHGDVTPGDNIFSYQAMVDGATTAGIKNLPATITDAQMRMGNATISLTITGSSTSPSGVGAANPNSVTAGFSTLLTVTVTPGTFPPSTGLAVAGDLSSIGGSATQTFFDDGSNGDATPGDNIFSYQATVTAATTTGNKTLATTITDTQTRTGNANISLFVQHVTTVMAIHDIQGSGNTSPFATMVVSTSGIVTGVKSNGFFIQTPDASVDADPNTSEGVFVFTSSTPPASAAAGNLVTVTGMVQEFIPSQDVNSPPVTEIAGSPTVSINSTGNALPAPITITAAATLVNDISNLEKYEGMRVHVNSLTTISPTQGSINEPSATSTSNGTFYAVVTGVARPFREPGIQVPDPLPSGTPCCVPRFDSNPERLRVDSDGLVGAAALEVTSGATIANVTGPLDYGFRTYTILPDPGTLTQGSVVGNVSATPVPVPNSDEFTVASFNMERFFDTVNDGNGAPTLTATAFNNRLNKASLAIRNVLRSPDILGIEEMENISTLQAVANKVNTDAGTPGDYQGYLVEGNDIGGIDVGFLVKSSRVTVIDVTQFGLTTTYIDPNTGNPALLNDRPPLVLRATVANPGGSPFAITVIVNHLRSLSGVDDPVDGNRVRTKRRAQAEYLANLIQARQMADPHERIISVGDYNVFQFNDGYVDSIGTIKGTPTPANQVVLASSDLVNPDLIDLLSQVTPASQQYSYSFDGDAQVLDHELVTANLLPQLTRIAYARNDADFPESFRNDPNRPERISDHDMAVAYFTESCLFALDRDHQSFAGGGGSGTVNVTAITGCAWTASTSSTFITINSGSMGTGDGVVTYSVAPNGGGTIRSDTLTIGGHTFTVYQGFDFLDVPSNYPFYDDIGKLAARGVTVGCGSGNYCPNAPVTREQMAAFMLRALGEPNPPTPGSQRFNDVPPQNIFYNFIDRLAVLNITLGCTPDHLFYCPADPVKRDQMAAFIIRGLGDFDPPTPPSQRFSDVPPTNLFYNAIDRMAVLNITLGCTPDHLMYCPSQSVTRAQMAAFLVRAFGL